MDRLNYHHLMYFWLVAREGGLAPAGKLLRLAPPTLSGQIRALESSLGHRLFRRSGRRLVLTDVGRVVFRYADEIFSLGRELGAVLESGVVPTISVFRVGLVESLPKMITRRLLTPVLSLQPAPRLVCREGSFERLVGDLASHDLDLVLADAPMPVESSVKAFSHLLGRCGVTFFAAEPGARGLKRGFPSSLDGAPLLVPLAGSPLRRELAEWFSARKITPRIVAELEDSALLKSFGSEGRGIFCAPTPVADQVSRMYGVIPIGETDEIVERFYAISPERRIKSDVALAISSAAKGDIFVL